MAILVTGGAGYIGSHTCVELLKAGKEVVLLDNFRNAKMEIPARIRQITGKDFAVCTVDLLHEEAVRRVFSEHTIEEVIHFAGLKAVGESVRMPLEYYHNNIAGTLILCRAMMEAGCSRLVFSSSATVYGTNTNVPFREDYPLSSTNPYGATKRMIEDILRDLCVANPSWSVVILRYFNPIGAHEGGLIGEDPNGIPNNLLPYVAQVAAGKLPYLRVYGNDYNTPDGTGVRDYLHVVDLATGHLRALEYARAHSGAEAFNLGTGTGYSVLDVVKAFEKASGVAIPYRVEARRPGDIATCYADPAKAEKMLGWKATRDLAIMCADSWRYTQSQANNGLGA